MHDNAKMTTDNHEPSEGGAKDQSIPEEKKKKVHKDKNSGKIETLEKQIEMLNAQLQTQKDQMLRVIAEFENYKRRNESEKSDLIRYGGENLVKDLLTVMDDFERSLSLIEENEINKPIRDGILLVYNNMIKVLDQKGVTSIESVGNPFDVHLHEAIMQIEKEGVEAEMVIEEVQKGYKFKDKVIRHAKVIISK